MKINRTTRPAILAGAILTASMAVSQADLIHYYTLDGETTGTAVDSGTAAGAGTDGAWAGDAAADERVTGLIGGAVKVNDEDGGNGQEHFRMTLSGLNGANALTVSAWFKLETDNNNSTYNGLFMTRDVDFDSGDDNGPMDPPDRDNQNWGLALRNNNNPRRADSRVNGAGSGNSTDLPDGNWHHMLMTWDGTTGERIIYVNGEVEDSGLIAEAQGIGRILAGGEWRLADDACCGERELNGTLDDVAVYDEVLTPEAVTALYENGLIGCGAAGLPGDTDCDGIPDDAENDGSMNPYMAGVFSDVPAGGPYVGHDTTDPLDKDSDGDGVTDGQEIMGSRNPYLGGVLTDDPAGGPYTGHDSTDPNSKFSDGDTMEDGVEMANKLDPNSDTGDQGDNGDPDMDLVVNTDELAGVSPYDPTDPQNPDSDGDDLTDGEELSGEKNAFDDIGLPVAGPPGATTDPNLFDTDDDGLNDGEETSGSQNPFLGGVLDAGYPDNDGDPTDPNSDDTDLDNLTDKQETDNRLDPNSDSDGNGPDDDPDMDDLTNEDEIATYFTDPRNEDSDGDEVKDGDETEGEINDVPHAFGATDPTKADSDGDTVPDGDELQGEYDDVAHGFGATDPLNPDMDNDGASDGLELAANPQSHPNDVNLLPTLTPVAYWPLDESSGTTTAEWVHLNDGVSVGTPSWVAGQIGGAADINGSASNSWFNTPQLTGMNGNVSLSISLWARPNASQTSYRGVFQTRSDGPSGTENWGIAFDNLERSDNRTPTGATTPPGVGPSSGLDSFSDGVSAGFAPGAWYHMVMTYNSVTEDVKIYTNGAETASGTASFPTTLAGTGWQLGGDGSTSARDFAGTLDDVAVFGVALSPADVTTIYNGGTAGTPMSVGDIFGLTAPPTPGVLQVTDISYDSGTDEVNLTWNSDGFAATFLVRANADLSTAVSTWPTVATGVANDGATTSTTITGQAGTRMYYVVEEE